MGARLGVDVGGTFTDLVAIVDGRIATAKVPSTPDQSDGVMGAVDRAEVAPGDVTAFAHGSTVATNALLERTGARTALVTTEGFRDVLEIGRQDRPSLYDLTRDRPEQLVPRDLRFTVRERTTQEGPLVDLDDEDVARVANALAEQDVDAVAVCFLFSYLHPEHEQRVGDALRRSLEDVHVSLSSDVLPEFREYERFATTAADAYLGPRLTAYLGRVSARARDGGLPPPLIMQSSGGVIDAERAVTASAACVLSGPAAGVVGAAFVARASGFDDVLSFDMGGTSSDVAPIVDGRVATTTEGEIGGVPIRLPMVDVHTVGAGGGSIAWVDEGGALRVGPRSAGADPGPASYGRGGEDATVTDADLLLGYMADGARLGGDIVLDRTRAETAVQAVAARLDLDVTAAAGGIVRVVEAEMVKALRVITVERGLDPREFTLVAFGGAGPMHACALAEELGIRTVVVPKASGVLSALGLAISDVRRDFSTPVPGALDDDVGARLERAFKEMELDGANAIDADGFERAVDLRYAGQAYELTVAAEPPDDLAARFHAAHDRRYGYRMDDEPVEVVTARVTATRAVEVPKVVDGPPVPDAAPRRRNLWLEGGWGAVDVWDRGDLGAGSTLEGPAVVELSEASCLVRPGWGGRIDLAGNLILERR